MTTPGGSGGDAGGGPPGAAGPGGSSSDKLGAAAPGGTLGAAEPAPEPSLAERVRTLLHLGRTAVLSTQSRGLPGFPFGSLAPYGLLADGSPTFLFSSLAVHTQNLIAEPRASLLVAEPGGGGDPLATGRATLLGRVGRVARGGAGAEREVDAVRADYLARHASARAWVDFADFAFFRMHVERVYYVGGFGVMGWIDAAEHARAEPDPLADSAPGILEHMNADHREALHLCCRAFAGVEADEVEMIAVDRLGFRVRARAADRVRALRIGFPREARSAGEARVVLVEMVREARARAASF